MKILNYIFISFILFNAEYSLAKNEKFIKITGSASEELNITYSVGYVAKKNTKLLCQSFNPLAGSWINKSERFYYQVNNESGNYELNLPLAEIDPDSYCDWQPYAITIAVGFNKPSTAFYSLISIDNIDGESFDRIDLYCKRINRGLVKKPDEFYISCQSLSKTPSLIKTISSNDKNLIVNIELNNA